ncbi:MAG TPA: hypothetical protein VGL89_02335 [Candidatus Koribacter sp.]
MLRFAHLQDSLRKLLSERIDSGDLTGVALAQKTGFRQAHISNFLNRKRGLSLEGMDRVLDVEDLSILDLIPADEINARASIPPPREDDYANIFLVEAANAARPQVQARDVVEVLKFKHSFLRRLRPDTDAARDNWLRFLMTRPCRVCVDAMYPRLAPHCTVLLDRHYTSLEPYRRGESSIYAVLHGNEVLFRKLSLEDKILVLRPDNEAAPIKLLPISKDSTPSELIIGRVAHVSQEI